jgi:uncharacterized protein (TIGR03067 family)
MQHRRFPITKYLLAVLVIGLILGAEEKKDDAKKDQETLQGTWKVVASETGGKDQTEEFKDHLLVFEGDTFALKKGDEIGVKGTFKLDPSEKPRAIDVTITEDGREGDKGKVLHGIYELDKGTLKWCTAEPGGTDRPKEFSTKEGINYMLVTLKKDKP